MNTVELPEMPWFLYDENERPVCTFNIEVLSALKVLTSAGVESHVMLELEFKDGKPVKVDVPLSDIERIDWPGLDKRCILNPDFARAKLHLANIIRLGLADEDLPVEELNLLDRTGIHRIGNTIAYCGGDRVITRSPDTDPLPKFKLAPLPFRLDIDTDAYLKQVAFDGMRELVSLSEIGRPLVAHAISAITRSAYIAAGAPPCTVLDIVTTTGKFKTYYAATVTQLYNRADEVTPVSRMDGTPRFIEEILYDFSECTAVIDDRCTAKSSSIKRKNDETAEKITRSVGDKTGRGRMNGKTRVQLKPRGNIVTTSEFETGIESTAARGLIVPLLTPIDGSRMDKYQRREPLLVSTFYFYYIEWYVAHYDDICAELGRRLTKFRETPPQIHPRLRETQFCLQSAYMLFLKFCEDSGFITAADAQSEYRSFGEQLVELVQAQHARTKPDKEQSGEVDYLKLIRKLYNSNTFRLADSVEFFNPDRHDGLIYKPYDCLCLRRENLEKRIRKIIPGANINDIIKSLLAQNALKLVGNKNQVQISALDGLRFCAIWLEKLQ